jgi:hypothetical protein
MAAELGNLPELVNAWREAHESGADMRSVNAALDDWDARPDRESWPHYEHGPYVDELVHYLTTYPVVFSWGDMGVQEVIERLDDVFKEEDVYEKELETTTGADLGLVLVEWREAIAHLKKARKSLRLWQRHYPAFEPGLDLGAFALIERAKELERATRTYRSMFDQAKSRGHFEVTSADKEYDPFS